jgi:hypothetical protein
MLTELHGKGGCLCEPARRGELRCPLVVRPTAEDVITGHVVRTLRTLNPRWWLPDLLNRALAANRFGQQCYRRLRIDPWVNQARYPRDLLPYDEGSTQVDCVITWENPPTTAFVEAKYGSDLSAGVANGDQSRGHPTDQLIRNIRVGLYACGYFRGNALFDSRPRDFVCILFVPVKGHPLVRRYRDEERLRAGIPYSHRLTGLPRLPFVGEADYADVAGVLRRRSRFLTRAERHLAEELATYLDFKRGRLGAPRTGLPTPLPLLADDAAGTS